MEIGHSDMSIGQISGAWRFALNTTSRPEFEAIIRLEQRSAPYVQSQDNNGSYLRGSRFRRYKRIGRTLHQRYR